MYQNSRTGTDVVRKVRSGLVEIDYNRIAAEFLITLFSNPDFRARAFI